MNIEISQDSIDNTTALMVLSGGQDSTTCLFQALHSGQYHRIDLVTFNYGQKHAIELIAANQVARIAKKYYPDLVGSHDIIHLPSGILRGTSPLTSSEHKLDKYESAEVLPGGLEKTFVPGRNVLFLTLAANLAYVNDNERIIIGVSEEDFGGYPDCRGVFIDHMQSAIRSGFDRDFEIVTPLIDVTKAQSILDSLDIKGWREAMSFSHTCYEGSVPPCGHCHACLLRSAAFEKAGVADPLVDRLNRDNFGGVPDEGTNSDE